MIRWESLGQDPVLGPHAPLLTELARRREAEIFGRSRNGAALLGALEAMPRVKPSSTDVDQARIRIGTPDDLDEAQHAALEDALRRLTPWRKGPFDVFGVPLDSEWNSAVKWNRLAGHLQPQVGRRILDIGASCGYYMFRMAARRPALVLGIEPYPTFYCQFLALSRYLALPGVHCLPLGLEDLPAMQGGFDTVLCMGILYHRRSPLDTLLQIHRLMPPGGQLVLETLIIEGDGDTALFPRHRYAKMKNVFFIPTVACLTHWLARTGFEDIRCVDVSKTTLNEQRKTDWIGTESLADFLDPHDDDKTIEGYPAPVRAMVLARSRRS